MQDEADDFDGGLEEKYEEKEEAEREEEGEDKKEGIGQNQVTFMHWFST